MFIHTGGPLWVLEMRRKKLERDTVESVEKLETTTAKRQNVWVFVNVALSLSFIDVEEVNVGKGSVSASALAL